MFITTEIAIGFVEKLVCRRPPGIGFCAIVTGPAEIGARLVGGWNRPGRNRDSLAKISIWLCSNSVLLPTSRPSAAMRYQPTTQKLQILINAFNNNEDYMTVGKAMVMPRRTVNHNIQEFQQTGRNAVAKRGGSLPKMDASMITFITSYVEDHPAVCLVHHCQV